MSSHHHSQPPSLVAQLAHDISCLRTKNQILELNAMTACDQYEALQCRYDEIAKAINALVATNRVFYRSSQNKPEMDDAAAFTLEMAGNDTGFHSTT